jgi:hypothetical protein
LNHSSQLLNQWCGFIALNILSQIPSLFATHSEPETPQVRDEQNQKKGKKEKPNRQIGR